jgi:hypothetical protein
LSIGFGRAATIPPLKERVCTAKLEDQGDIVEVRVRYGRPTHEGWESWKDWDGYRFTTERGTLTNRRMYTIAL